MQIYAIGDLHLAHSVNKPMDIFGPQWTDHVGKIGRACRQQMTSDDLLLIVGDISWAMTEEEAKPDLEWIHALPGSKLMIRGNHDYWWPGPKRMRSLLPESIDFLRNDSRLINGIGFAGSRGWDCPPPQPTAAGSDGSSSVWHDNQPGGRPYSEKDLKIYHREVERLRSSLTSLHQHGERKSLVVMLHYPPMNASHQDSGFSKLLEEAKVDLCIYGHLHGEGHRAAFCGERNGVHYQCVACDFIDFRPLLIADDQARLVVAAS